MIENLKPAYNTLLMPIAKLLAKQHIHPNGITFAGLVISILAALFAARGDWLAAALLIVAGSCMDGLDGLVARYADKNTSSGAILDSTSDRLTEIVWLFGILFFYVHHPVYSKWGMYLSFIAITGSLMVSYVRARCEGVNIPCKIGLLQRPERVIILIGCFLAGPVIMIWGLLFLSVLAYATMVQRLIIAYTVCKNIKQYNLSMRND
jgi:CDP-diacylglycerol--glycerol-3-phosphate 3-phosphatidyltransferase